MMITTTTRIVGGDTHGTRSWGALKSPHKTSTASEKCRPCTTCRAAARRRYPATLQIPTPLFSWLHVSPRAASPSSQFKSPVHVSRLFCAGTRAAVPPTHSYKYIAALQHAVGMQRRHNQRRPLLLKVIDDDTEVAAASIVVAASDGAPAASTQQAQSVSLTTAADAGSIAAARFEAGHAADIFCFLADALGLEWVSPSAVAVESTSERFHGTYTQ